MKTFIFFPASMVCIALATAAVQIPPAFSTEQFDDRWEIVATVEETITRRAKKSFTVAEVTVQPDHPLLKPGTYKITKENSLLDQKGGRATIRLIVDVDTSDNNFILDGQQPITCISSGTVAWRDNEKKMEFINAEVAEFSSKETRSFIGSVQEGSFILHHTPKYQYFDVSASSLGQNKTVFERYIDGSWESTPSTGQQSASIGAAWSSGEKGGSITRSGSGYSFTLNKTETSEKEDTEFGKITTVIKKTVHGTIRPLSRRSAVKVQEVHFNYTGGQEQDKFITLKRHKDNSDIKAPEWTRDGKYREPAAFVREYQFKIKAKFEADKNVEWAKISAEEETKEGGGFGGIVQKTVEFKDGKEGEGEFIVTNAQEVVGVNKVKWKWKAKVKYKDEDKPKDMELNSTEHTIYIVGGKPVKADEIDTYVYVVKMGCEWAEGTKGGYETFKKIWEAGEFAGYNVPCPDETPCPQNFPPDMAPGVLAYSGPETETTKSLLNSGRGSCGAWQDFFYDVVGCQGIRVKKFDMKPDPEMGFDRLVVKSIPAQGVCMPHRIFTNHAIIEYNGKLYDPSYHLKPSNDLHEYENQTYEAYCNVDNVINAEICAELQNDEMEPVEYERFTQCIVEENPGCSKNDKTKCEVIPGK